ncbi:hypothetical protein [Nocardia brevicatena]|uniref:hypothetical protein n=1 Tax=Nocardia brevicatena TaxID=37327 RepID=UPI000594F1EC|nr:hypothetical protein [Nocardia brevicatena]
MGGLVGGALGGGFAAWMEGGDFGDIMIGAGTGFGGGLLGAGVSKLLSSGARMLARSGADDAIQAAARRAGNETVRERGSPALGRNEPLVDVDQRLYRMARNSALDRRTAGTFEDRMSRFFSGAGRRNDVWGRPPGLLHYRNFGQTALISTFSAGAAAHYRIPPGGTWVGGHVKVMGQGPFKAHPPDGGFLYQPEDLSEGIKRWYGAGPPYVSLATALAETWESFGNGDPAKRRVTVLPGVSAGDSARSNMDEYNKAAARLRKAADRFYNIESRVLEKVSATAEATKEGRKRIADLIDAINDAAPDAAGDENFVAMVAKALEQVKDITTDATNQNEENAREIDQDTDTTKGPGSEGGKNTPGEKDTDTADDKNPKKPGDKDDDSKKPGDKDDSKTQDTTPKPQDTTPKPQDTTPKPQEITPKPQDTTPPRSDISPTPSPSPGPSPSPAPSSPSPAPRTPGFDPTMMMLPMMMSQMANKTPHDRTPRDRGEDRPSERRGRSTPWTATPQNSPAPPAATNQPAPTATQPATNTPAEPPRGATATPPAGTPPPGRTPDPDGTLEYPFPDGRKQRVSHVVAQALDAAFADKEGTDAKAAYTRTPAQWTDDHDAGTRIDPYQLATGDIATWADRTAITVVFGTGDSGTLEVVSNGALTPFTARMHDKHGDFGLFAGFIHPRHVEPVATQGTETAVPDPQTGIPV